MPRKKGSLNKPKAGSNLFVTKMEKQIEGSAVTKKNALGWVNWGERNDFPNLLLNLYSQSPTHAACINFGVQSILGDGIDYEESNFDGNEVTPNYYQNWEELLRSISLDFKLYGSYAIECILNKDGETMSYFHIPLEKVRWSVYDEDGQITKYYICNDWTMASQNPPIEIDAFDMRPDTKVEKGKPYLYVYRPYSPTMTYYTAPHYQAGIKAIQAEIAYLLFDEKTTTNGFVPSGMLLLDEVEDDLERQAIINNITRMFSGVENANSLMISFRRSQEEQAPAFVPFSTNTSNVNLYDSANQRTINRILAAHQINDPQLIGLPNPGSTAFNSEGKLLETAYNVYNKVVGNYDRQCVIKTFNFMLALNGIDTQLVMKPLSFNLETSESKSTDTTTSNAEIDDGDYTEDNVEEKVDGSNTVVKGFKQ